ncbi:uncharacterized protein LOC142232173 [Haematobia irritans]|uniref:uncharacterized protein LOC142232173 n=1 Tax=Haematobia irritans TaxID=7368 RepID=UPI003F4F87F6
MANTRENELLLNAIKNKFSAKSNENLESPPKFMIPSLRIGSSNIPSSKVDSSSFPEISSSESSPLNQYLLKQLQERSSQNGATQKECQNNFVLPSLHDAKGEKQSTELEFEIPLLKKPSNATSKNDCNKHISSLTTAIDQLELNALKHQIPNCSRMENAIAAPSQPNTTTIDLSSALSKSSQHQISTPPTRVFHTRHLKSQHQEKTDIEFEIPFIDCDRVVDSTSKFVLLAPANEYCQIDISDVTLKPSPVQNPSAVGHFLCCIVDKQYIPYPLKYLSPSQQHATTKYDIKPFQFDTKSPDDIVLASLEKYQRRHLH